MRPDYVTTRYGNDSSSLSQQADVIVVRLFAVLGHTLNVPYLGRHHLGFRQFRIGFGGHALIQRVMQPLNDGGIGIGPDSQEAHRPQIHIAALLGIGLGERGGSR